MFNAYALLSLVAISLAGTTLGQSTEKLDDTDPRVVCTPGFQAPFRCVGLDKCSNVISWWSVTDFSAYHGGTLLVSDDLQQAVCQVFFQGTGIALHGLRVDNGATGFYTIDTASPVKFDWATTSTGPSHIDKIFEATGLASGNHSVFIEIQQGPLDPSSGTGTYLASVDYFETTA